MYQSSDSYSHSAPVIELGEDARGRFITRTCAHPLAAIVALAAIVSGVLFGFELAPMFSVAMIAFAGAAIQQRRRFPDDSGWIADVFSLALRMKYTLSLPVSFALGSPTEFGRRKGFSGNRRTATTRPQTT